MNRTPQNIATAWVWVGWLCVLILLCVMSIQPVAQFVDTSDVTLYPVANSSGLETRSDNDGVFRWGSPGTTIHMPTLPAGRYLLAAILSVPQTAATVTISAEGVPIATFSAVADQFRRYHLLVGVPPSGLQTRTSITLDSNQRYDDGLRTLTVAYGTLAFTPTRLPWQPVWSLDLLLYVALVLAWAGLTTLLRSTPAIHVALMACVCMYGIAVSQLAGMRWIWLVCAVVAASLATLAMGVQRWWTAPHSGGEPQHTVRAATHPYRADIDGLRALAVGVVVLYHAFPEQFPGGFIGVDVFFVISGYLISQILFERVADGTYSLLDFYARRVRRIFPALGVVLLTVLVSAQWLFPRELMQAIGLHVAAGAGFVANLLSAAQAGYFDDTAVRKPLLHLWSLGIEEQFYLIWPFVIVALVRARRLAPWILGSMAIASFAANLWTTGDPAGIAFYWPMMRVWQFVAGAALAYAVHTRTTAKRPARTRWPALSQPWASTAIGVGALGVLIACTVGFDKQTPYPGWAALLPTLATGALLAAKPTDWVQQWLLARRGMVALGVISYPLYLWHWPLLAYGYLLWDARFDTVWRIGAVLVAVILAAATYWFIEQPIRFGRLRQLNPLLLAALMAVIGTTAWAGVASGLTQTATAAHVQADIPYVVNGSACGTAAFAAYPYKYCSFHSGTDPQAEDIYVVGDSHALYLARGFFSRRDAQTVYLRGIYGCVPLLGIETYVNAATTNNDCSAGVEALYASLDRVDATQHRTIIFAARFTGLNDAKLNRTDSHTLHLQGPGVRTTVTPSQRTALYRSALERTLARLAAYPNTTVIVLAQVPELDFNPSMCAYAVNADDPCQTSRATVDAYVAPYRVLLDSVAARYPTIRLFDPTHLFCDAQWCRARGGDVLWYRDDNHLSVAGARYVIEQLALRRDKISGISD